MSVREYIDKNKPMAAMAAGAIFIIVLVMIFRTNSSGISGPLTSAYYTTDDGSTYFSDDVNKLYPFDKGGKPAYRAFVYKCSAGSPFVGYVAKISEKGINQIAALHETPADQSNPTIVSIAIANTQVKKPGETKWVSTDSAAGAVVMTPICPNGGNSPEGVYP